MRDKAKIKTFLMMSVLGGLLVAGCATVPPAGKTTLKEVCDKYGIAWQLDSVSQILTLSRGRVKASALVGSETVLLDSQSIRMKGPIERYRQTIIVPEDFESKIIERMLKIPAVPSKLKHFKVVVDAGHGGNDPGTISRSGIKEKGIVLDIAQRLARKLRERGFDVVMTRDRDESVSLERRTEIATRANADFFISIHANSNPSRSLDGIEIYCCKELGTKEKNDDQLRRNYDLLFRSLSMQRDRTVKQIVADMLSVYKRSESSSLAGTVAAQMVRDLGVENHGIKRSGFFVVRNTLLPAVLIETGFLSNQREAKLLNTSSYRQQIAETLAESLKRTLERP